MNKIEVRRRQAKYAQNRSLGWCSALGSAAKPRMATGTWAERFAARMATSK